MYIYQVIYALSEDHLSGHYVYIDSVRMHL